MLHYLLLILFLRKKSSKSARFLTRGLSALSRSRCSQGSDQNLQSLSAIVQRTMTSLGGWSSCEMHSLNKDEMINCHEVQVKSVVNKTEMTLQASNIWNTETFLLWVCTVVLFWACRRCWTVFSDSSRIIPQWMFWWVWVKPEHPHWQEENKRETPQALCGIQPLFCPLCYEATVNFQCSSCDLGDS